MQELDARALAAIDKVEKLLNLANHPNTAPEEAEAATAAAQRLLEAYNLDMAQIERASGRSEKATDNHIAGGLYKWQRELWHAVAKLNFCMYRYTEGNRAGGKYKHRLIGRRANLKAAQVMAEYLQQTIERMARERVGMDGTQFFTKSSISFREGMADRLVSRLQEKRQQLVEEAERKKAEEAAKSQHPAYATSNALTIVDVIQSEEDAVNDFLCGEGYSARNRARRAAAEAEYEARMAAQAKWELEHPEEAAAKKAEEERRYQEYLKAEERRAKRRKGTGYRGRTYKGDSAAYWAGHSKGGDVGLDQQIDQRSTKKLTS